VVRGALHPLEGHEEGPGGASAAEGDHGAAEDEVGTSKLQFY
jgi:hypothetical protein